jgi:hypothetical protein
MNKSDTVLKKEFKSRDVQRARNLIQGKVGDKIGMGVGYTKKEEFHSEGDIWEIDGKKWTIKDGIKQNVTRFDAAKKLHQTPIFCPNCNTQMKKHFDKDYYMIHKKCFDCVIDFEHDLHKSGLYESYEKNIRNADIDGFIKDFKLYVEDELIQSNSSHIAENGDVEKWDGNLNKERVIEALDKTIKHLEEMKK